MLRRICFRIILLLLSAGLLVLVDYLAGKFYPLVTPAAGRDAVAALLGQQNKSSQTGYFLQHPYLHYTYLPYYEAFNATQFNARGYRGDEVSLVPTPGTLRILAIGGSTTVSFPYVTAPDDAWPAQVQAKLREQTGLMVEVINAGLHDANSADLLLHYLFRNRYLQPDIVVIHVGGNDGVALLFDDYNPEYTHYTHGWRGAALTARPLERLLLRSNLVKVLYAWWLRRLSLAATLGRDDITQLTPVQCLRNARANSPVGFERNLDLMIRTISQDRAIPVLFPFIWAPPHIFRLAGRYGLYADALICAFEKDRAVMESMARQNNLALITLPTNAIADECFVDFCHVNLDGETIKANYVTRALIPVINALNQDGRFPKIPTNVPPARLKQEAQERYENAMMLTNGTPVRQREMLLQALAAYPRHEPALRRLHQLLVAANEPGQAARIQAYLEHAFKPQIPVAVDFGDGVRLLGITTEESSCAPGKQFKMTWFWQCPPAFPYNQWSVFAHFRGEKTFQGDHQFMAGIPPAAIQYQPFPEIFAVETTITVPADMPAGEYRLWMGLYNSATGVRLAPNTALSTSNNAIELPVSLELRQ